MDEICPSLYAHGDTHHALPLREGRKDTYVLTCQYCGATHRNGRWIPPGNEDGNAP